MDARTHLQSHLVRVIVMFKGHTDTILIKQRGPVLLHQQCNVIKLSLLEVASNVSTQTVVEWNECMTYSTGWIDRCMIDWNFVLEMLHFLQILT